jgi:hypothetical protein
MNWKHQTPPQRYPHSTPTNDLKPTVLRSVGLSQPISQIIAQNQTRRSTAPRLGVRRVHWSAGHLWATHREWGASILDLRMGAISLRWREEAENTRRCPPELYHRFLSHITCCEVNRNSISRREHRENTGWGSKRTQSTLKHTVKTDTKILNKHVTDGSKRNKHSQLTYIIIIDIINSHPSSVLGSKRGFKTALCAERTPDRQVLPGSTTRREGGHRHISTTRREGDHRHVSTTRREGYILIIKTKIFDEQLLRYGI